MLLLVCHRVVCPLGLAHALSRGCPPVVVGRCKVRILLSHVVPFPTFLSLRPWHGPPASFSPFVLSYLFLLLPCPIFFSFCPLLSFPPKFQPIVRTLNSGSQSLVSTVLASFAAGKLGKASGLEWWELSKCDIGTIGVSNNEY